MDPNQLPDGKPYALGTTQSGRAVSLGSNVKLYLAVLTDRNGLVHVETEMLPQTALYIAQSLLNAAAEAR